MSRRDLSKFPARAALLRALAGLALAFSVGPAGADTLEVSVDHARVVRLPDGVKTVIVGNPGIADVAVQKSGVMVVTGKTYGTTNLISLDAGGAVVGESLIRVEAQSDAVVVVQRGLERETYSCTPACLPTLSLGDTGKYFESVTAQSGARNGFATGK